MSLQRPVLLSLPNTNSTTSGPSSKNIITETYPAAKAVYRFLGKSENLGINLHSSVINTCSVEEIAEVLPFINKQLQGSGGNLTQFGDTKGWVPDTANMAWASKLLGKRRMSKQF
jgi:hypothetical protein